MVLLHNVYTMVLDTAYFIKLGHIFGWHFGRISWLAYVLYSNAIDMFVMCWNRN